MASDDSRTIRALPPDAAATLDQQADDLRRALARFVETQGHALDRVARESAERLRRGGKLLLFGNGGSAAQAQHLAAEFVNRFELRRDGLAALALGADSAVLSSIANDEHFDRVFARQIEALGRPADVALALSSSGRSPNVVAGLRAARAKGMFTAALLGCEGGAARDCADIVVLVEGRSVARIQEVQLFAGHVLCGRIERLTAGT